MGELKEKITSLIYKHRRFLAYGFFGTVSTTLNIALYALLYRLLGLPNTVSTIIAWTVTVFVSFITTKLYVFESKSMEKEIFFTELTKVHRCTYPDRSARSFLHVHRSRCDGWTGRDRKSHRQRHRDHIELCALQTRRLQKAP